MFRAFRVWPAPDSAARALANFKNVRGRIVSPENFIEHEGDNNISLKLSDRFLLTL